MKILCAFGLLVSSVFVDSGFAATNGFFAPSFRGSPNSEAGYWEVFTAAAGGGNLPDRAGSTTGALLTQSDTNAFLTGTGNIYNLSGASAFTLADVTPFPVRTVVLQARTLGAELDYGSVSLVYSNDSGQHAVAPLPRVELNRGSQPGLGTTVSSHWQWDLSGLDVTEYTILFRAASASLSFDALTLDTSDQFVPLFTPAFSVNDTAPVIERWMYSFNAAPCDRTAGSVFGSFGDESGVDTRHAQQLVGWDTAPLIPTNRGPGGYIVSRCRVTLTINRGNLFAYDPTHDDFRTYFETNHASYVADADTGRPVELFGAGFRNGYDAATFNQCAPFGTNTPAQRNAYAAGYSTNGVLVDVSNNVGKTNEAFLPFEAAPFAIGQATNAAPGELVPAGAKITFDLNLNDPFVLAYIQSGLNSGRLRFVVSSLHTTAGQFGMPSYPDFATHFNEAVVEATRLEIEGIAIAPGDVDSDGLPDDWELVSLGTLTHTATADADSDGASNLAEFRAGTDPLSAASKLQLWVHCASNGTTTVSFPFAAGRKYTLEFSDNLTAWSQLASSPVFDLSLGVARWSDNAPASARRLYRVRID